MGSQVLRTAVVVYAVIIGFGAAYLAAKRVSRPDCPATARCSP